MVVVGVVVVAGEEEVWQCKRRSGEGECGYLGMGGREERKCGNEHRREESKEREKGRE